MTINIRYSFKKRVDYENGVRNFKNNLINDDRFLICLFWPIAEVESAVGNPKNGMHPHKVQTVMWSPLGSGTNNEVSAIASSGDTVYAGGFFQTAGGNSTSFVAMWNYTNWTSLGNGIGGTSPYVSAIAVSGNDIYVGGLFSQAGGRCSSDVAMWNGYMWAPLGNGITIYNTSFDKNFSGTVSTVAVSGDDVYVGGNFDHAGNISAHGIAMWNGKTWNSLGNEFDTVGAGETQVSTLPISKNRVYAGGWFTISAANAVGIAKWDGVKWSSLGSGISSSFSSLGALALCSSGNNIYVGGSFNTTGGINANNVAMLVETSEISGVQYDKPSVPGEFSLNQNYPNPFNPSTVIAFDIPESDLVTLKVYDVLGREIRTLVSKVEQPGGYSVTFNAGGLPSEVYLYRLKAGKYSSIKKLLRLK